MPCIVTLQMLLCFHNLPLKYCWLRGTVVESWSLTGELSLSCARPTADG